ncbi:MAG: site-specific DNA-methyltransferase, partial [Flavobacteriaceae bacterium]|nr:site-specific DNA-methyltransferase [Flavobacteriaceae bacterium]
EESLDWDTTQNLYIEGDNLEVLKLLQKSYAGKIKMIYIDPPYNTGKDFVYKDNYKDNLKNYQEVTGQLDSEGNKLSTNSDSDGRFHSNWLSMMYPRLILARNLLSDDGVIFISIDNSEVKNLKNICDEIFGENNRYNEIVWNKKNAQNDVQGIQKNHEYILVYQRKGVNISVQKDIKIEVFTDKFGCYHLSSGFTIGGQGSTLNDRPNLGHTIYFNEKLSSFVALRDYNLDLAKFSNEISEVYEDNIELINKGYVPIRPPRKGNLLGRWTWSLEKFNSSKELVYIRKLKNGAYLLRQKKYIDPNKQHLEFENDKIYVKYVKSSPPRSIMEASSSSGTSLLNTMIGNKIFPNPKPVDLIVSLVGLITSRCDEMPIILDFFSGSGTSAHSILELNSRDNGKRKFIQVQLPEKTDKNSQAYKSGYSTIAEIGKERIRRVVKKIKEEHPIISKELDLGFKVFKLDSSNIKSWDGNPDNVETSLLDTVENIKPDRTEEDVLYEILLKSGLDLTLPIEERNIEEKKVFNIGLGALFICLADNITRKVAEGIGQWKNECNPEICRVVFKDNGFSDVEKTNSAQTLKRYGIDEIKTI